MAEKKTYTIHPGPFVESFEYNPRSLNPLHHLIAWFGVLHFLIGASLVLWVVLWVSALGKLKQLLWK